MEEFLRSIKKVSPPSASSSEDNNRSTLKRLFSSVFSLIDSDHEVSHFDLPEKPSRVESLLKNPVFVAHLLSKIRSQGLCEGYSLPIIRLTVSPGFSYCPSATPGTQKAQLDRNDLLGAVGRFGELKKITLSPDRTQAFIFFNSFLNAYICFKTLRNCELGGGTLRLVAQWVCSSDITQEMAGEVSAFINGLNWQSLFEVKQSQDGLEEQPSPVFSGRQNKYTCRYDIQIENEREFQVARRIIGSKGCHMKRILEECLASNTENKNTGNECANQLLKLRLRGRGSGYKEGPEQLESNESLHLCVSAKDEVIYNGACTRVEQLLNSIYKEYAEFTRRQGTSLQLSIKRVIVGSGVGDDAVPSAQPVIGQGGQDQQQEGLEDSYRISPQKIGELLQLRNKARRELNFGEADRIRNYLRGCGVCLIDEKGRRGKANEVTTWKYLY